MAALREITLRVSAALPSPIRRFIYRHPALLRPLARLLKRIVPSRRPVVVTIPAGPNRGRRLAVDRGVPNYFWLNPEYEPAVQRAIAAALGPGMTALDVGAHMGFDTLQMAALVGPKGRVIAFEPDRDNYRRLRRNCHLNGLRQVSCRRAAVAAESAERQFCGSGDTTSHLANDGDAGATLVTAVALDDILARPGERADLIKVDVEGAEAAVLQGAGRVLRELRPTWIVEVHSYTALLECGRQLVAARYRIAPLVAGRFYAAAVEALNSGRDPAVEGFDIGHVLATPIEHGSVCSRLQTDQPATLK